jgi:hypothetical protein
MLGLEHEDITGHKKAQERGHGRGAEPALGQPRKLERPPGHDQG